MDNSRDIETPDARKFVFTRRLPTTGQTVSYQDGDDGYYEAGWNIGQRFIPKTLSGDDVVVDRSTGLMWPKHFNQAGGNMDVGLTWPNALIYCEALNFAGFTDWRLPNILEIATLYNFGMVGPANPRHYLPFFNFGGAANLFWSSTTNIRSTDKAWFFYNGANGPVIDDLAKTSVLKILAVREICG